MPQYEVKLGFGLHVGWAIEGAIGSFYKIDASYLSPNVELTAKLEGATKGFGVPLLISGELRAICSKEAEALMRHVDSVRFVTSGVKCDIYTIDMDPEKINTDFNQVSYTRKQAKLRRVKAKLNRERYRNQCIDGTHSALDKFETDPDLKAVRRGITNDFYKTWNDAHQHYIRGDWLAAKPALEKVHKARGKVDQPTLNLLAIMKGRTYCPPRGWTGTRECDDI